MQEQQEKGVPRFVMEAGMALLTGAFGVATVYGSQEAGTGWTEMGPDAGYFPFYIGLLIVFGSLVNLVFSFVKHRPAGEIFATGPQFKAVAGFLVPLIVFAGISTVLGLYVGTALYIAGVMILLSVALPDFEAAVSAAIAGFSNIGPLYAVGWGDPATWIPYSGFDGFAKLVFIAVMILGRLEVLIVFAAFNLAYWRS